MMRKTSFLILALSVVVMYGNATAFPLPTMVDVLYTGDICSNRPGSVRLCAQVTPRFPGYPVVFEGETVFGTRFEYGPFYTDVLGRVCVLANVFPGVYGVRASVQPEEAVDPESPGVILTVFSSLNPFFHGIVACGAVTQRHTGLPPLDLVTTAPRKATFGLIAKLNQPGSFQFAYWDSAGPLGTNFLVYASTYTYINNTGTSAEFRGPAVYETGGSQRFGHYQLFVSNTPGGTTFRVIVTSFTGLVVYDSGVFIDETVVMNGQVRFIP